MDIRKLQRAIVDGLEDVKAQDIKVFNTSHLTELFDRVIVASGTSNRQTKALASSVREKVKEAGGDIISTEGEDIGEWVLVDCGDAVVHILQPALRQYYNLEEIWGDKPVHVKLSTVSGFSGARPSEPMDDDEDDIEEVARVAATKPATKKATRAQVAPAAKSAAKPAAARKSPARKTAAPARKTAARRSAAK
ncbi:ribosome silencing factor [Paraburkholderia dinghuensis]|uniref:Ribosomal silencing factor RsfS n=1 Tax=Paraburkholderia dinghuensis TaxID=2305225 RepID=A0A3N6P4E2_9BURK|nr:ribosome silencing factor [Paraburkholderia dinghuensis]RQH08543.1 ribosome silencing factor [Paraburkholderia dinghuensis]